MISSTFAKPFHLGIILDQTSRSSSLRYNKIFTKLNIFRVRMLEVRFKIFKKIPVLHFLVYNDLLYYAGLIISFIV